MDNIRPSGTRDAQVNQAYIGQATDRTGGTCYLGWEALPCDFTREFPLVISPDTMLRVKIDKMNINQMIPAQDCGTTFWPTGAYQGIVLTFSHFDGNGQKLTKRIQVTVPGHENLMTAKLLVSEGIETSVNLYEVLAYGGAFEPPVTLESINVVQQMLNLCSTSGIEHAQHMEIDYIRIEK